MLCCVLKVSLFFFFVSFFCFSFQCLRWVFRQYRTIFCQVEVSNRYTSVIKTSSIVGRVYSGKVAVRFYNAVSPQWRSRNDRRKKYNRRRISISRFIAAANNNRTKVLRSGRPKNKMAKNPRCSRGAIINVAKPLCLIQSASPIFSLTNHRNDRRRVQFIVECCTRSIERGIIPGLEPRPIEFDRHSQQDR